MLLIISALSTAHPESGRGLQSAAAGKLRRFIGCFLPISQEKIRGSPSHPCYIVLVGYPPALPKAEGISPLFYAEAGALPAPVVSRVFFRCVLLLASS